MPQRIAIAMAVSAFMAGPGPTRAARAVDVCGLLLRQTQAFSDAGQAGDAATLDRLLDPQVVFVNEDGDTASKHDLVTGAAAPPKNVHIRMKVTDWTCAVHGGTAVARFTDDQTGDAYGQKLHAQFRSVETWQQQGAAWRMIGSQTVALQDDPAAVTLPAATLDDYVGTYRASADMTVTLTRNGTDLMASLNGGPASAQKAELRDVFFTPGHPRVRKIFQRNTGGAVTGFVSRHEGHDIFFRRA